MGPKPPWCRPRCERLTSFYCSMINTPISGELESHTLLIMANSSARFSTSSSFFFLFFHCHTFFFCPPPRGGGAQGEQYLASHFMDLRSAFSGWMWVDICRGPLGEQQKAETEWERSKSVISTPLCVSQPTNILRGSEDILPDTRKCHQIAGIIDSVIYF